MLSLGSCYLFPFFFFFPVLVVVADVVVPPPTFPSPGVTPLSISFSPTPAIGAAPLTASSSSTSSTTTFDRGLEFVIWVRRRRLSDSKRFRIIDEKVLYFKHYRLQLFSNQMSEQEYDNAEEGGEGWGKNQDGGGGRTVVSSVSFNTSSPVLGTKRIQYRT